MKSDVLNSVDDVVMGKMPTFKNIHVPVGTMGKTRLQRVQVLASGKFKFVKNLKKGTGSAKTKTKRSNPKSKGKVNRTSGKMFRSLSGAGAMEDVAWGFIGFNILGGTVAALPMTRVVQGVVGHAMDRRGKNRLVLGILDLVAIWLSGVKVTGGPSFGNGLTQPPLQAFQQLLKISPL